jgi:undecaprenyl-diphosphatase
MFDFFYFILGLIQGLTEFLPVSSSGHLALAQQVYSNLEKESLLIEITAHFGSLLAIGFYYRKSFIASLQNVNPNDDFRKIFILFLSTLPAGLVGLFLKDTITDLFSSIQTIAYGFLFTSFALVLTRYLTNKRSSDYKQSSWPTPAGAIFIGFAQALALLPGISRSGSTIAAGILTGLKPKDSAFFSFCSVAPLILAATALSIYKIFSHAERLTQSETPLNLSVLLVSSFFFGWLGLRLVVRFLEKDKFHWFAAYLTPLAFYLIYRGSF